MTCLSLAINLVEGSQDAFNEIMPKIREIIDRGDELFISIV